MIKSLVLDRHYFQESKLLRVVFFTICEGKVNNLTIRESVFIFWSRETVCPPAYLSAPKLHVTSASKSP